MTRSSALHVGAESKSGSRRSGPLCARSSKIRRRRRDRSGGARRRAVGSQGRTFDDRFGSGCSAELRLQITGSGPSRRMNRAGLVGEPRAVERGAATEALDPAIDVVWSRTDVQTITAYIEDGQNEPSRRVAAKLGFAVRSTGRGRSGEPMTVYTLCRDDWLRRL